MNFIENNVPNSSISFEKYLEEYRKSIDDPENFWREKASSLTWIKNFTKVKELSNLPRVL